MRYRAILLLIALAGCRQILGIEDPVATIPTDAPADTGNDGASDGAIDGLEPATCMMRWSTTPVFGAPVALATLNSGADEDHPFLSPDELTIYFTRGADVYTAKRPDFAAAFGAAVTEPSLNGTATEGKVFVSADDSRAFFASNRAGGSGGFDLWRGARSGGGGGSFSVDQMYLPGLNDAGTQVDPHLSTDLLRLYYATDISGVRRIASASRNNTNQNFAAATPLIAATGGTDIGPTLTQNELVLVFGSSSTEPGDLYYASRASLGSDFPSPLPLSSLNTTSAESSPHVSADGCRLYFTQIRGGSRDLVVATML